MLIEEPFILEDPIGRPAPVHLQFITSWDAFNAVLEIRFRSVQGHRKIVQKEYGLQEEVTGREINQSGQACYQRWRVEIGSYGQYR
jgi:hypothetical protein